MKTEIYNIIRYAMQGEKNFNKCDALQLASVPAPINTYLLLLHKSPMGPGGISDSSIMTQKMPFWPEKKAQANSLFSQLCAGQLID